MTETTSTAPNGEQFPLPTQQDEAAELQRLQALVADSVRKGTDFTPGKGTDLKSVPFPGVQRPSPRSYWKIPLLNRGVAPVEAEDPEVAPMIARCVL